MELQMTNNALLSDKEKDNVWCVLKYIDERFGMQWVKIPNLQVIGLFDSQYSSWGLVREVLLRRC